MQGNLAQIAQKAQKFMDLCRNAMLGLPGG
jgi:hypothetical protein